MPPALQNPITLWLLLTAALAGLVYAFMRTELRWRAIGRSEEHTSELQSH